VRSVDALVELFRQKGFKITPQRRAIFEILAQDDSHPTAEDIYQRVLSVMPDISRTTVYNTLRELVDLGELFEVENASEGGTRYDTNTDRHHHLFCLKCHRLVDISRDFAALELSPEEAAGYQIVRRQVTFYGYCPNCQKQEEEKE
jgi:Fur family peroxide stress response transcriptional regulator